MKSNFFWRFRGNEVVHLKKILNRGLRPKKEKNFNLLLEKKWCDLHKIKYSVTVNSCTSALHIALLSLFLKKGDEVLVPSLTPAMCAYAIIYSGLTPVFVDSDKNTFLMDPQDLQKKITSKTKAIILVHMYSGICDGDIFKKIAKKNKLVIIEDCAEALGAKDRNGNIVGSIGDIACWSFQYAKHITCGDGGIISTQNKKLAENIRKFSNLGFKFLKADADKIRVSKNILQSPRAKRFSLVGYNYRMNEFSAAIVLAQLERLNLFLKLRRYVGLRMLKLINQSNFLTAQQIDKKSYSTFYTLPIIINNSKISWKKFREVFMSYGGDSISAASQVLQNEPSIQNSGLGKCYNSCSKKCIINCHGTPVAKYLQKKLLNFCTNQGSIAEAKKQINALKKTIKYFNE
jgi:perosamine synthetase